MMKKMFILFETTRLMESGSYLNSLISKM